MPSDGAFRSRSDVFEIVANVVSAYVSNNNVPVTELPALIASVHAALAGLGNETPAELTHSEKVTAAQIRKSITPDALISFEDGKPYKTLRRHLTLRGLTPEAYREKHGLSADYPMTTANYSAQRSALARSFGFGQQRRKSVSKVAPLDEIFANISGSRNSKSEADNTSNAAPKTRGLNNSAEMA